MPSSPEWNGSGRCSEYDVLYKEISVLAGDHLYRRLLVVLQAAYDGGSPSVPGRGQGGSFL